MGGGISLKIGNPAHIIVALGCLSLIYFAFDVHGDGAQTKDTVVAQVRKGVPPRIREQSPSGILVPRDPTERGVPDIREETRVRPDLRPGPCAVLCDRGEGYSVNVCSQYGYSSQFKYKVIAGMRNVSDETAYFAVGWRMWQVIPLSGLGAAIPVDVLQLQKAPPGGYYLRGRADMPVSRGPMLFNLVLSPGTHSVEFIVDPDNRIVETNEGNNTIRCSWNVVAMAPDAPFDLAITDLSVSPRSGPSYENFELTVTVKNLGSALFDTINTVCRPGGSFYDSGLDENEERTSTYFIPVTLSPGTITLTCTVDAINYTDSDTSNNTMTTTFTVTPP
jgi:hypothetical protein